MPTRVPHVVTAIRSLACAAAAVFLMGALPRSAGIPCLDRTPQLQAYMTEAARSLGAPQQDALSRIEDEARRGLALASYLRAGKDIGSRWSWTSDRIKAHEKSKEHAAALAEIGRIAACFATENPDHVLYSNTKVRSLEEQVALWATNHSVGEAAAALRKAALAELDRGLYAEEPNEPSVRRFREFLKSWRPPRLTTMAAPGLSLHGRGRAFDFQIRDKEGRVIAGSDSTSIKKIWNEQGWAEKLKRVVEDVSDRFSGPLANPNEPWHYNYDPGVPERVPPVLVARTRPSPLPAASSAPRNILASQLPPQIAAAKTPDRFLLTLTATSPAGPQPQLQVLPQIAAAPANRFRITLPAVTPAGTQSPVPPQVAAAATPGRLRITLPGITPAEPQRESPVPPQVAAAPTPRRFVIALPGITPAEARTASPAPMCELPAPVTPAAGANARS